MYLCRIFIILLFASSLHGQDDVSTTIRILSDDPDIIQQTIDAIETRLAYAGYEASISPSDSAQLFRISTTLEAGSKTDSILYYSQIENNEMEFGIALRQDDQIVRLLYKDLVAVDGLYMQEANNPSAIFLSRDPQLLDEQLDNLNQRIASLPNPKFQDLEFCWSTQAVRITKPDETYMAHVLYAYNSSAEYGINESNIHSVEIVRSTLGEDIHFTFKSDAQDNWLDITHQAAKDNARAILIMLNNEVINAQRIPTANHSGKGIITRIRLRDRAIALARKIRIGRLPVEVEIINTIRPNEIED